MEILDILSSVRGHLIYTQGERERKEGTPLEQLCGVPPKVGALAEMFLAQKTATTMGTHKTRRYNLLPRVFTGLIAPCSQIPHALQILVGFYPPAIARVSSLLPA